MSTENIWAGTEEAPKAPPAPNTSPEQPNPDPQGPSTKPGTPTEIPPQTAPKQAPVPGEPGTGEVGGPPPVGPQPTGEGAWTPERVAELLKVARGPEAPAQPPQMSEEEMRKMLNVVTVGQDDLTQVLNGGEPAVEAMNRILQAAVTQARTTAWYQTKMLLKQHQDALAPVMTHFHQAEQERLTRRFFDEYKEFQPEKHNKLLGAVKSSLDAENAFEGKDVKTSFKLIADRAKELLAASGTPLVPVSGAAQQGAAPKMAQLSRGAGHGAAAADATTGAPSNNTAKRFFG